MDENTEAERGVNLFKVTQVAGGGTSYLCETKAHGCREVIVFFIHAGIERDS